MTESDTSVTVMEGDASVTMMKSDTSMNEIKWHYYMADCFRVL